MDLYLVRHAIAEDPVVGSSDFSRTLTKEGERKFAKVVRRLEAMEIQLDQIYTSPKIRAVQTAEMLSGLCSSDIRIVDDLALSPSKLLLDILERESVAWVGHEPWLGDVCSMLIGGGSVRLKKGGVVHLRGEKGFGNFALLGLWSPKSMGVK